MALQLSDSAGQWQHKLLRFAGNGPIATEEDAKTLHTRCAMVKRYGYEMAHRVCDRVVQIFGGRGYLSSDMRGYVNGYMNGYMNGFMSGYAPERSNRTPWLNQIRKGSSEVQGRMIAKSRLKTGLEGM
jgi:alkylation response protein AidB-like acyl-CoA dehydrogenase